MLEQFIDGSGRVLSSRPSRRESPSTAFTADDSRIEKIPESGCWIWMRTLTASGYGIVRGPHGIVAHRNFFAKRFGVIPVGMDLDHLCRVRSCCNPDHLRVVTRKQNLYAVGSLSPAKKFGERSVCPKCQGPFVVVNNKKGRYRRCRPCHNAGVAASARRLRAARHTGAN